MNRCKICVMPDTRPDHVFVDGVCPACLNVEKKKQIDWDKRYKELEQLLDKHHGECIVPSSGGKDSTFQAITLKAMGAHVTAVTARTCHLTEVGRLNIDNLANHVRTIEYVPNMTVRAKMNKNALQTVGDISHPEHMAIFTTPFIASRDLNIPLVMYGENPQMEYGGPDGTENSAKMTARWRSEFGGFLGMRPKDYVGFEGITEKDVQDYELPDHDIEAHFLGYYLPWDSRKNYEVAKEYGFSIGWYYAGYPPPSSSNHWAFENLDNAQTGIHDYFMFLKYGYGRACTQISVDIRNGLITREEGLSLVVKRDGRYPERYMDNSLGEILDRIGVSVSEFDRLVSVYAR